MTTPIIIDDSLLQKFLPKRLHTTHKGDFGHLLVVGGDYGMAGAARMAAEAGARVGAGLVSVATRLEHLSVIQQGRPELMCHAAKKTKDILPLLAKSTTVILGPGLGKDNWGRGLFKETLLAKQPLLVDADALNLLAVQPQYSERWVLTPHPGEAARLLHVAVTDIQADRLAAAQAIQTRYGGICVLKGAGTLVVGGKKTWLCSAGNPGMATGGMGDVLSGVIGGLLAQGLSSEYAAAVGVYVHAKAGDCAAASLGERGLLAGDLMAYLQAVVNP